MIQPLVINQIVNDIDLTMIFPHNLLLQEMDNMTFKLSIIIIMEMANQFEEFFIQLFN